LVPSFDLTMMIYHYQQARSKPRVHSSNRESSGARDL
jgi:hypothetical protein